MKRLWVILPLLFIFSCEDKKEEKTEINYLIFGHFYGFCSGEECIEIFKLTETKLFEDINDNYPGQSPYDGSFEVIGNDKFKLVKDLMKYFPENILNESKLVFGCPDCADQGGLYIEYNVNGTARNWSIDQNKTQVPSYLHDFMDRINKKIKIINDITK